MLYPLQFKPVFKDKIWGGGQIQTVLGKDFTPLPNCGESWEISGMESHPSVIVNGFLAGNTLAEAVEIYMGDLVGEKIYDLYGNEFPLLIKFIDAAADLSVQVHPDDAHAQQRGFDHGKTEMWYVLSAREGARISIGFKTPLTRDMVNEHLQNNTLERVLHHVPVRTGDVFFIPAGTVHAIGKGVLLAEIQQSSDLTYRMYDYNRKDSQGKLRQLHIEDALESIHYSHLHNSPLDYPRRQNQTSNIVFCPYFAVNCVDFDQQVEKIYADMDSFVIYICVEGECILQTDVDAMRMRKGECVLLPACFEQVVLTPVSACRLLETYIP
jgi:mannose-6-phosphate isomerase